MDNFLAYFLDITEKTNCFLVLSTYVCRVRGMELDSQDWPLRHDNVLLSFEQVMHLYLVVWKRELV